MRQGNEVVRLTFLLPIPFLEDELTVIRINKSVTLLLPFHRHTLQLSHRLLNGLGGVSGFLLQALADGLTLPQLVEVTGLSANALLQQLGFLEQHHFVTFDRNGDTPAIVLAERGARMVAVQGLLANLKPTVWLDAFTLKHHAVHLLTSLDTEQLLQIPEDAVFRDQLTVRMPMRYRVYRPFEQLNRLRSLLDEGALLTLLMYFDPEQGALIAEEAAHWEYSLSYPERDEPPSYFPVVFDDGEFCLAPRAQPPGRATLPPAVLPVLGLTRRFEQADDFPWPVSVPSPSTDYVELVSQTRLAGFRPEPEAQGNSSGAIVFPMSIDRAPPTWLPDTVLPPGVASTLAASRHELACELDHAALSRQMHLYEDILLFSFNHKDMEAEPA